MGFRHRLMIVICLLAALSFGIGGGILITASFQTNLQENISGALNTYEAMYSTLSLLDTLGQGNTDSMVSVLEQLPGPWQALRLTQGEETLFLLGKDSHFSSLLPQPTGTECVYITTGDAIGESLQLRSQVSAGENTLTLDARFDLRPVYQARRAQQQIFLIIYAAVILVCILVSAALSARLTKQLRLLTRSVRRIASGDLATRSGIDSDDEFGQLSRDFDAMADKLQQSIGVLKEDMQRQEAFMGAFAHELKTPMTAIIGYADLLRQDGLEETTRLLAADYIFSEGQRLEKLSLKLLELLVLNKDDFTMQSVNLQQYLQQIEHALGPVMKQRGVRFVCRGDRGRVMLEPDLTRSLLYNLADNAAKAMDSGGIIAIRGVLIPGGCQLQVVDNGRGMAQEELAKITQAFYRVDKSRSRQQGGAGLGLALCRQIAELHSGSLQFQSAPGTGTRVTATLYGGRKQHEKK